MGPFWGVQKRNRLVGNEVVRCEITYQGVGAIDYTGGPIGAKVNLRDDYGFGNTQPDHSGQFMRNIQKLAALYKRMRDTLEE